MKKAIESMKKGKPAGCSGLPIDLIKHLGESGVDMMHEILKRDPEEEQMPEEWKKSEIVPTYKQTEDPLECGNFRVIKLLEHGMKMFEKILERRLRKLITVNNMLFGFSPGKGTTDAVFIIQTARKTPRSAQGFGVLVSEKERGPREASEASRSKIPWSINSSENHAWQN